MTLTRQKAGQGLDSFRIAHEIRYAVTRARVWDALTRGVNHWWPHRTLATDRPWINTVSLEARQGGQFKERWSDGEGALWGTVVQIENQKLLRLNGSLGMLMSPVVSCYSYELRDMENGTLVSLTHDCFGMLEDGWAERYHAGWLEVLDVYLRGWLERGMTSLHLNDEKRR
jgi:uncharacterized protein YndB with AHSA1/START domain